MELIDAYLENGIAKARFWITNNNKEIFEVKCKTINVKPHHIYTGAFLIEIIMEDWVYEGIERDASGWKNRLRMVVIENHNHEATAYRLFTGEKTPAAYQGMVSYQATARIEEGEN